MINDAIETLEYLIWTIDNGFDEGFKTMNSEFVKTQVLQAIKEMNEANSQKPVPWVTKERFYEAMEKTVERTRQDMRIKAVTMRCDDQHIALPIIDVHAGNVLVGQVTPPRKWVGLTNVDMPADRNGDQSFWDGAQFADAWLKEKNT